MEMHTLGPEATDSNDAAHYYCRQHPEQDWHIQLHVSFEEIIAHLVNYHGDFLLIPAAFQSQQLQASWGDLHYQLLDQLELITSFVTQLDPLVVVERVDATDELGYTHAATAQLLQRLVPTVKIRTAPSKYAAYQAYQRHGKYVLTNQKNVQLRPDERILKTVQSKMVWCLYQIK